MKSAEETSLVDIFNPSRNLSASSICIESIIKDREKLHCSLLSSKLSKHKIFHPCSSSAVRTSGVIVQDYLLHMLPAFFAAIVSSHENKCESFTTLSQPRYHRLFAL
eukprot:756215-Hanusia_phi.AAC.10